MSCKEKRIKIQGKKMCSEPGRNERKNSLMNGEVCFFDIYMFYIFHAVGRIVCGY